jgi:HlyD family secretion protein
MDTSQAIKHNLIMALAVMGVIVAVATFWSTAAPLEGAVVTSGTVIVEGSVKKVQHPTGGIVGDLRVKEGDAVKAGDLLIRLDEVVTRANLGIVLNELTSQRARLARLQASRDGVKDPVFPADLVETAAEHPATRDVLDGEARLCRFKLSTREEQKEQLAERVKQLGQEILGLEEQVKSLKGQLRIARQEFDDLTPLAQAGTVQRPRVTGVEREVLRHQGLLGETVAKIAQSQAKIAETELQIVQGDHDFMTDVIKEMRETETKITELRERKVTVEDQLRRLDIRAPIGGMVHQLAVHTIGGVISPSETLMLVVPSADRLIVEVRISPADIDQVTVGQETRVRFSAFNRRTTDELKGSVVRVAADLTHEPQTGVSYYTAGVSVSEEEMAALKGLKLVPGMPAEVFIKTGERTLASYLTRPLADQMARAFRER